MTVTWGALLRDARTELAAVVNGTGGHAGHERWQAGGLVQCSCGESAPGRLPEEPAQ